jgi:hypothetical protein
LSMKTAALGFTPITFPSALSSAFWSVAKR